MMTNLSKMTKEQLLEMVQKQQAQQASGLMVKRNASGGVFVRAESFVEWSDKKQKSYTAGINLPANTAKVLFNDANLIEIIREAINDLPDHVSDEN